VEAVTIIIQKNARNFELHISDQKGEFLLRGISAFESDMPVMAATILGVENFS